MGSIWPRSWPGCLGGRDGSDHGNNGAAKPHPKRPAKRSRWSISTTCPASREARRRAKSQSLTPLWSRPSTTPAGPARCPGHELVTPGSAGPTGWIQSRRKTGRPEPVFVNALHPRAAPLYIRQRVEEGFVQRGTNVNHQIPNAAGITDSASPELTTTSGDAVVRQIDDARGSGQPTFGQARPWVVAVPGWRLRQLSRQRPRAPLQLRHGINPHHRRRAHDLQIRTRRHSTSRR